MQPVRKPAPPQLFRFESDGSVPNNPTLPLVIFPGAIDLAGTPDPEDRIERLIARNGWRDSWRNGIYPYVHYHSSIHEFLAVARGRAKVRFGGNGGEEITLRAGDAAILPAGTGHQGLWTSADFVLIGAYPRGGKLDLCRGSRAEHDKALAAIPNVPLPETDPVFGADGPLLQIWRG